METKILVLLMLTSSVFAYFDIELQRMIQTFGDKDNFIDIPNMKVKKIPGTKTRGLFGPIIIHGDLDNTFKILCNAYVKQGGEYRLMPFKVTPQPYCDTFNNEKQFVPDFVKFSNFTQPLPCPVPKGTYIVDGYTINLPDGLMMAVQSGEYAGEMNLVNKDGEVVLSLMTYVAIVKV